MGRGGQRRDRVAFCERCTEKMAIAMMGLDDRPARFYGLFCVRVRVRVRVCVVCVCARVRARVVLRMLDPIAGLARVGFGGPQGSCGRPCCGAR